MRGARLTVQGASVWLEGVIGFFVDAKNNVAAGNYRQFGFIPLPDNAFELFLPIATIRKAFKTI